MKALTLRRLVQHEGHRTWYDFAQYDSVIEALDHLQRAVKGPHVVEVQIVDSSDFGRVFFASKAWIIAQHLTVR